MSNSIKSLFTASPVMRLFMFNSSLIVMLGIWLTGFETVHWFLYVLPVAFLFASVTGLCLGLVFPRILFGR